MLVLEEFDSTKNYMDIVNCSLAALKVKEGGNVHKEYEEESFTEIYSEKSGKFRQINTWYLYQITSVKIFKICYQI